MGRCVLFSGLGLLLASSARNGLRAVYAYKMDFANLPAMATVFNNFRQYKNRGEEMKDNCERCGKPESAGANGLCDECDRKTISDIRGKTEKYAGKRKQTYFREPKVRDMCDRLGEGFGKRIGDY